MPPSALARADARAATAASRGEPERLPRPALRHRATEVAHNASDSGAP